MRNSLDVVAFGEIDEVALLCFLRNVKRFLENLTAKQMRKGKYEEITLKCCCVVEIRLKAKDIHELEDHIKVIQRSTLNFHELAPLLP